MFPWKSLLAFDRQSKKSVFLQIAEGMINAIRSGHLRAGQRLPGSRQLAGFLEINRKTALLAYDELLSQGWIISRYSRGTFVAESLPILQSRPWSSSEFSIKNESDFSWSVPDYLSPPATFSYPMAFDDGLPDTRLAPIEELARAYSRNLRNLWDRGSLSYSDGLGDYQLRTVLARELNESRGLNLRAENVMITRGSQMAIFLAARIILSPSGRTAAMTYPGYRTAGLNFRYAGGQVIALPVDQEGMVVSALEKICKQQRVHLVYVTPHHHYPTTVRLSPQRRMQLLQLANQYDFAILEDDYDYDFHYDNSPLLPLASGDRRGRVLYVGSFSKNISPAIRMGYLVGPSNLIRELPRIRRLIDRQGDLIMEAAIAELMEEGIIKRYLKKALKQYRQRRDQCCTQLKEQLGDCLDFEKPRGGLAIWAKWHPSIQLPLLSQKLRQHGVYLADGKWYAPEANAIRMGFAGMTEPELIRAVAIIQQTIRATFPTFVPDN